jgi:hypothetical protein
MDRISMMMRVVDTIAIIIISYSVDITPLMMMRLIQSIGTHGLPVFVGGEGTSMSASVSLCQRK